MLKLVIRPIRSCVGDTIYVQQIRGFGEVLSHLPAPFGMAQAWFSNQFKAG